MAHAKKWIPSPAKSPAPVQLDHRLQQNTLSASAKNGSLIKCFKQPTYLLTLPADILKSSLHQTPDNCKNSFSNNCPLQALSTVTSGLENNGWLLSCPQPGVRSHFVWVSFVLHQVVSWARSQVVEVQGRGSFKPTNATLSPPAWFCMKDGQWPEPF